MANYIIVDLSDSFVHNAQSREEVEFLDYLGAELEELGFETLEDDMTDYSGMYADDDEEYDPDLDEDEGFAYAWGAKWSPATQRRVERIVARYKKDTDQEIYIEVHDEAWVKTHYPELPALLDDSARMSARASRKQPDDDKKTGRAVRASRESKVKRVKGGPAELAARKAKKK